MADFNGFDRFLGAFQPPYVRVTGREEGEQRALLATLDRANGLPFYMREIGLPSGVTATTFYGRAEGREEAILLRDPLRNTEFLYVRG
ncbi:hypothetical protein HYY74_07510 [Candidatus Woesearchaeota archaeon]|nr:hypothetical protein [Candidatus Woesearchaeota archaeon]